MYIRWSCQDTTLLQCIGLSQRKGKATIPKMNRKETTHHSHLYSRLESRPLNILATNVPPGDSTCAVMLRAARRSCRTSQECHGYGRAKEEHVREVFQIEQSRIHDPQAIHHGWTRLSNMFPSKRILATGTGAEEHTPWSECGHQIRGASRKTATAPELVGTRRCRAGR